MAQETTVTGAILAVYESLSESERRVADFILNSADDDVSSLLATEIAQRSGTSNTTVSRFVRTLGYDSYGQLRVALAREETARERDGEEAEGISFDDVAGSMRYVLDCKREELADTAAGIDVGELERVARLIQGAGLVLVVGVGTSLEFAQMAAVKLTHVGVRAVAPGTSDAASTLSLLLTSRDCIIFVSNSGRSRRLSAIMDTAQDRSVPTALVTADATSSLAGRADHVLAVSARDRLLAEGIMLSHNSLNFVMEVITQLLLHDSAEGGTYIRQYSRSAKAASEK